jgi:hypothetical protein
LKWRCYYKAAVGARKAANVARSTEEENQIVALQRKIQAVKDGRAVQVDPSLTPGCPQLDPSLTPA